MKKIIKENIDILLFSIALLFIELLLRLYVGFDLSKQPFVFDLAYIILFDGLLMLLKSKPRKIIEVIFLLIISIYSFAQEIHNNFFSSFFRISKINILGELPQVAGEVGAKVDFKSFLIFLVLLIFITLIFFFKNVNYSFSYKKQLVIAISCIAMFNLVIFGMNKKLEKEIINDGWNNWNNDKYLRETISSSKRYCDRFGVYDYIFNDIKHEIKKNENNVLSNEDINEIDAYIEESNINTNVNKYTGVYKGKNLVLVLAESLNNFPIDEEITPTLYKMASEGFYFDNYYAPLYQGSTSDSEFISQTSMLPSLAGVTCYTYGSNAYPYGLANLFKNNGYNVESFHSSYASYYNRETFHQSLGFDTFYGIETLSIPYPPYFQVGLNWIEDSVLINFSLNRTNVGEKFYDFIISASGHMPYVYRDENDYNLNELNNNPRFSGLSEETKHYLASQMNLDKGLQQLLIDLEDKGILNDTIIAVYGDHYPYGITDDNAKQEVIYSGEYGYEKYRVPFIIYDPSGNTEAQINHTLGSTFDIYPTLCNLFGLDYTNAFVMGDDLLGDNKHEIPFMDGSILTDDFYYNAETGGIDFFDGETDNYKEIINSVKKRFEIGKKVVTGDYYAKKQDEE
ncbi:MAG: LTA synthase family protein [Solobacterium sp.]|nr:LTA synthase family protein [Solobacterium sp.]MDY5402587.1 LTA synthase family protein [Erysipelotrichaceae bacterium]